MPDGWCLSAVGCSLLTAETKQKFFPSIGKDSGGHSHNQPLTTPTPALPLTRPFIPFPSSVLFCSQIHFYKAKTWKIRLAANAFTLFHTGWWTANGANLSQCHTSNPEITGHTQKRWKWAKKKVKGSLSHCQYPVHRSGVQPAMFLTTANIILTTLVWCKCFQKPVWMMELTILVTYIVQFTVKQCRWFPKALFGWMFATYYCTNYG